MIDERMSAIYDRFKAQEDNVEQQQTDQELHQETETNARRAREKEAKRRQVGREKPGEIYRAVLCHASTPQAWAPPCVLMEWGDGFPAIFCVACGCE